MIGAGDNSNHGFWLVTDCTKLPTIGIVGWDCGLSTNMFLGLAKSMRDNVQCAYMFFLVLTGCIKLAQKAISIQKRY